MRLDISRLELEHDGSICRVTRMHARLLALLADAYPAGLGYDELTKGLWDGRSTPANPVQTIGSHVCHLRLRLDVAGLPDVLRWPRLSGRIFATMSIKVARDGRSVLMRAETIETIRTLLAPLRNRPAVREALSHLGGA